MVERDYVFGMYLWKDISLSYEASATARYYLEALHNEIAVLVD